MAKERFLYLFAYGLMTATLPAHAAVDAAAAPNPAALFYVATNGNDAWSGKLAEPDAAKADGPFATLERARDGIRSLKKAGGLPNGGVAVELRGGIYEMKAPFELTPDDSGTEQAPIVYRARKGETVRLLGGKVVTGWAPVTDPAVLARLDDAARGKVFQADLTAQGVTDLGDVAAAGKRLELFFQSSPMTLARWPNEGFVNMVDMVGGAPHRIHGLQGDKIGRFTYAGDRPQRWVGEKDAWLHGYWFWDWADEYEKIETIDTAKRVIALTPPYCGYGYRKGQRFYALNVLAELDAPGEWYLDRERGILYFWPPTPVETGEAIVSVLPTLVTLKDVAFVTLRGVTLEAVRGTAATVSGGTGNRVAACTIRNAGSYAVSVSGTANGVVGCDIYQTGDGGITLNGGDRKTLTPADNFADNNHIHHYSRVHRICQPAIGVYGVGNRASHNLMHDAPHIAILFGGNDHVIEFNEIHSVLWEVNDAGAIYAGREWTMRGTVIRHNYIHHVYGPGLHKDPIIWGIYLDDMFCGTTIYGNVFYKLTRGARIAGGRDNTIENNVFVDCNPAVEVHSVGVWAMAVPHIAQWKKELTRNPFYKQPPYDRYPGLANILEDEPELAKGNVVARNICQGPWANIQTVEKDAKGVWVVSQKKWKEGGQPPVLMKDNLVNEDAHFVDAAHANFQLRDDSPAWKLGFQRIPTEKIGLYRDDLRASWPVTHQVREPERPAPDATKPVAAARTGPPPTFRVPRAGAAIQVDGTITPDEWAGADSAKAMVIEQGLEGEKVTPGSLAWFAYDDQCLYVAINNTVYPATPLRPGNQWGQDDAVELAFRNTAAGKDAPILVLRGYPSGHFESSPEAGAPETAVKKAAEGVAYGAKVIDLGHWTAEWKLPFASLGMDPATLTKLAFNLSVRKTAGPDWVLWQGTNAATWEVGSAGLIELAK